jgi:SUMO ligase MMS21 Smc5/6 complex component
VGQGRKEKEEVMRLSIEMHASMEDTTMVMIFVIAGARDECLAATDMLYQHLLDQRHPEDRDQYGKTFNQISVMSIRRPGESIKNFGTYQEDNIAQLRYTANKLFDEVQRHMNNQSKEAVSRMQRMLRVVENAKQEAEQAGRDAEARAFQVVLNRMSSV